MSVLNEINVDCERCGEEFQADVWTAVHAGENPELKELLLGGELNLVLCPGCGQISFQDRFVLYSEPAAEILAYVYPEAQRAERSDLSKMMMKGFREAQQVFPEKERLD